MASDMVTPQHNCEGLPDYTVAIDLEVMTLTGIQTYRKDGNCSERHFIPWSENTPPPTFLKKVKETQEERRFSALLGYPKSRNICFFRTVK